MRIGELSEQSGFSVDTLRYYEKIGLIPAVPRDHGGRRDYGPAELRWLGFLRRLNETGMSIRNRLRFARLREQGTETITERRKMLVQHHEVVAQQIKALQETLVILEEKVEHYRSLESQSDIKPSKEQRIG